MEGRAGDERRLDLRHVEKLELAVDGDICN